MDLVIYDEAQRTPANTFSKLAFIKKYRLGLTGTAWREDDRQHLIVALSGFPVAIRWSEMIASGVLRRPRIVVATVPFDAAKIGYVKSLLTHRKGRTLIFCDWLEQGSPGQRARCRSSMAIPRANCKARKSEVCVVSLAIANLVPDLRLVIEWPRRVHP
jgi:hypothetical protein